MQIYSLLQKIDTTIQRSFKFLVLVFIVFKILEIFMNVFFKFCIVACETNFCIFIHNYIFMCFVFTSFCFSYLTYMSVLIVITIFLINVDCWTTIIFTFQLFIYIFIPFNIHWKKKTKNKASPTSKQKLFKCFQDCHYILKYTNKLDVYTFKMKMLITRMMCLLITICKVLSNFLLEKNVSVC